MSCPITDEISVQLYGDAALQARLVSLLEGQGFKVQIRADKPYQTKQGKTGQYRNLKVTTN